MLNTASGRTAFFPRWSVQWWQHSCVWALALRDRSGLPSCWLFMTGEQHRRRLLPADWSFGEYDIPMKWSVKQNRRSELALLMQSTNQIRGER